MQLRAHQKELQVYLSDLEDVDLPVRVLADVVPGGGKSMLPGLLAQRFPSLPIACFVPRLSLRRQMAVGLKKSFGIDIRESENEWNPRRGTRGFVATHASLTTNPDLWADELRRGPYLLVIDEMHHAKVPRSGEQNALASAISRLKFGLFMGMTGTLETNDNSLIYGLEYKSTPSGYCLEYEETASGLALSQESFNGHVISYTRKKALAEKAIVPVEFHHHDGPVKWENKFGVQEATLSQVGRDAESQAIWTALQTSLADELLDNCVEHWREYGQRLLVVTADQQSAKHYQKRLKAQGFSVGLAISEAESAHDDIERFRGGFFDVLVTCQMAYEGLDVPEITHVAALTHIRSVPWIEQMLARAWRATGSKTKCWAFVPSDPRMDRVIQRIRDEQPEVIPFENTSPTGTGGSGKTEHAFVAISGQVEAIRSQLLDGSITPTEFETAIQSAVISHGFSLEDPRVAKLLAMVRELGQPKQNAEVVTVKEREHSIRVHMKKTCSRADKQKSVTPGTHQKRLNEALGYRKFKDMSLEELERARKTCANICS